MERCTKFSWHRYKKEQSLILVNAYLDVSLLRNLFARYKVTDAWKYENEELWHKMNVFIGLIQHSKAGRKETVY